MEEVLSDLMFWTPSDHTVESIRITKAYVDKTGEAEIVRNPDRKPERCACPTIPRDGLGRIRPHKLHATPPDGCPAALFLDGPQATGNFALQNLLISYNLPITLPCISTGYPI